MGNKDGPRGHPPREWDRAELLEKFLQYIEETPIPVIAEFAYQNRVTREVLYAWEEGWVEALEMCRCKKESALELGALKGTLTPAMAIFSLKQMGWSDKVESLLKGDKNQPVALTLIGSDIQG